MSQRRLNAHHIFSFFFEIQKVKVEATNFQICQRQQCKNRQLMGWKAAFQTSHRMPSGLE